MSATGGPAWLSRLHAAQQSPAQANDLKTDVRTRLVHGQEMTALWKQVKDVLGEDARIESVAKSAWKWQHDAASAPPTPVPTPTLSSAPAGMAVDSDSAVLRAAQACATRKRQLSTTSGAQMFGENSPSSESTMSITSANGHLQAQEPASNFAEGKRRRFE